MELEKLPGRIYSGADKLKTCGRICILSENHLTSNPRVVKEADSLAQAGYQVQVVYREFSSSIARMDAVLRSQRPQWSSHVVRWGRAARFKARLWANADEAPWADSYLSAIHAFSPDLIIAHSITSLQIAVLAESRFTIPFAFDMEDLYWGESADERHNAKRRQLLEEVLPKALYISTSAPAMSEEVARIPGVKRVHTILNCFPLDPLDEDLELKDPPQKLRCYWFSQTIGLDRGLQDGIRAAAILKGRIELHLRGHLDRKTQEQFLAIAESECVKDALHFQPPCESDGIYASMRGFHVGLALEVPRTRHHEVCISNKILHYPVAGLAVVATALMGQSWVMEQAPGMGFLYPPGDAEALAEGLLKWLEEPGALNGCRLAARKAAEEQFNWEKEKRVLLAAVNTALA
jgi:glycosyltransferase involved in cell wall biosynthesis